MNREDIEHSLTEPDGACRDINFSRYISGAGAVALLAFVARHRMLTAATDANGTSVCQDDFKALLETESGALSTVWKGEPDPGHLQVFLHWSELDRIFCELTFFPQDIDKKRFSLDGFLAMLAGLCTAAQSVEYYVRFEDASWRHGECADHRSVIMSHLTMPFTARYLANDQSTFHLYPEPPAQPDG